MTTALPLSIAPAQPNESHVARLLPPTAPAPEPARRIIFLKALLLFWLFPRRYGPHLAVGSIWRALAAHALAVGCALTVAGGIVAAENVQQVGGRGLSLHTIRILAAEAVLMTAAATASGKANWIPALVAVLVVPAAVAGLLLVATAAMPWCAGGDSAWSVWKRSVKNTYWSTTILIPTALVTAVAYGTLSRWVPPGMYHDEIVLLSILLSAYFVPILLFIRMLAVGADRYVGEPTGPAFSPREPLCDGCGYRIVALPLDARCPECGLPVRDSLPGGRRQPTLWEAHEFRPRGFVELLRMQIEVLRGDSLFRRVPVQQGLSAARHFWWATLLLMELVLLGVLRVAFMVGDSDSGGTLGTLILGSVAAVTLPLLVQVLMMFGGCLAAQIALGVRDYRVSAAACYYAAPLMWPLIAAAAAATLLFAGPWAPALAEAEFAILGMEITVQMFLALVLAVAAIASLAFQCSRLETALRAVRYANV